MSILWIYFAANVVIGILSTVGTIFDLPETFLAMTVLAISNSLAGNYCIMNRLFPEY